MYVDMTFQWCIVAIEKGGKAWKVTQRRNRGTGKKSNAAVGETAAHSRASALLNLNLSPTSLCHSFTLMYTLNTLYTLFRVHIEKHLSMHETLFLSRICSRILVGCFVLIQTLLLFLRGTRAVTSRCGSPLLSISTDACALLITSSHSKATFVLPYGLQLLKTCQALAHRCVR